MTCAFREAINVDGATSTRGPGVVYLVMSHRRPDCPIPHNTNSKRALASYLNVDVGAVAVQYRRRHHRRTTPDLQQGVASEADAANEVEMATKSMGAKLCREEACEQARSYINTKGLKFIHLVDDVVDESRVLLGSASSLGRPLQAGQRL